MRRLSSLVLIFLSSSLHATVDADDVRKGLEHRWFDIEVIIFERLDTFEFNTVERLTSTDSPSWSHGFVSYDSEVLEDFAEPDGMGPDSRCIGFPMVPEASEPHPILAALNEADRIAAELERQNILSDITIAEGTSSEANELGEPPPVDIPQSSPALVSPPPTARGNYERNLRAFEQTLSTNSFKFEKGRDLEAHVRSINRQRHLRPIFHKRWRQMTPPRSAPIPIRIEVPENEPRLKGTISLTVERYLHFKTNLWYETPDLGELPRFLSTDGASQATKPTDRFVHIRNSRRMRSEEMHYIDHPKVGILVYVTPLEVPQPLIDELALVLETESLNQ